MREEKERKMLDSIIEELWKQVHFLETKLRGQGGTPEEYGEKLFCSEAARTLMHHASGIDQGDFHITRRERVIQEFRQGISERNRADKEWNKHSLELANKLQILWKGKKSITPD